MYLKAIIVNIMEFDIQTTYGLKGPFNAKNKPFFSLKIQAWRQEFRAPVSVFICIDKSGSMQNTWKNVLKAFEWLLRKSSLDTTDSFAVVLFSDDVETIMELTPYSEESVTMVLSMLQKHLPNGGTNLNGALKEMIRMMDEKYVATLQTNSQATLQTNSQATLQTNSFANSSGICCIITDGEPSMEYGGPIDIMKTMQRKYKTLSRSNISSASSAFTPYRSKMTAATSAACDAACDAALDAALDAASTASSAATSTSGAASSSANTTMYNPFNHVLANHPSLFAAASALRRTHSMMSAGTVTGTKESAELSQLELNLQRTSSVLPYPMWVIGLGSECNDRLQMLIARAGGGRSVALESNSSKNVPIDEGEFANALRLAFADLIGDASSIVCRDVKLEVVSRFSIHWRGSSGTVLPDINGLLTVKIGNLKSEEELLGALMIEPTAGLICGIKIATATITWASNLQTFDIWMPPAEKVESTDVTDSLIIPEAYWPIMRDDVLTALDNAMIKEGTERSDALTEAAKMLSEGPCRELPHVQPLLELIRSLQTNRVSNAIAYGAISFQRSITGTAPPPQTQFSRSMSLMASQM